MLSIPKIGYLLHYQGLPFMDPRLKESKKKKTQEILKYSCFSVCGRTGYYINGDYAQEQLENHLLSLLLATKDTRRTDTENSPVA